MTDVPGDIGRRLGGLSDLPPELRKLLSVGKLDQLEEQIVEVLKGFDRVANVDEVIVGLYRTFQCIPDDRRTIAMKLYRMSKSGVVESVPGKKGVFRLL